MGGRRAHGAWGSLDREGGRGKKQMLWLVGLMWLLLLRNRSGDGDGDGDSCGAGLLLSVY